MTDQNEQPSPRALWGPLWPLGEALRFLTILPIGGLPAMSERAIARSIRFFPLAGAVIGALLAPIGLASGALWDDWVRAIAIVAGWAIITAGLHLDGLSDTFDAVMSWRSRERKLEIMKDSRIGAMGAIALLVLILLKIALLHAAGAGWLRAVVLAPVLGRWADIYGIFSFPPARAGGLGREFQSQAGRAGLVIATGIALALALAIGGARGLIALALVWGVSRWLARWWTRDLGGLTGDTYGALCEIAEVVALAVMSAKL